MGFSFEIKFDFAEFESFVDHKVYEANAKGLRMGLNRGLKFGVNEAVRGIKAEFPLGAGGKVSFTDRIKGDIKIGKFAQGNNIADMEAEIAIESERAVQMIRAVKSLKVSKRGSAPIPAQVRAGHLMSLGGNRFVQKFKGNPLVYIRSSSKLNRDGKPLIEPQRLKRIALMLQDEAVWPLFESNTMDKLNDEVSKAIDFQLSKL